MSMVSEIMAGMQSAQTNEVADTSKTSGKTKVSGKTVGNPALSEKAAKCYEQLKKKYSNMDFVLVSSDMKEFAKAHAGSFANPYKLAVLIDEEKIERMAVDEDFRKQYEAILNNAASGVSQLAKQLEASGTKVKGFGMQIDDGGNASFFAVIDKSLAAQRDRIAKKAAEKKEAKKAEAKKAQKEAYEERTQNHKSEKKGKPEDEVVITASSIDELIDKINDWLYGERSNYILTDEERKVGQSVDFSV